MKHIGFNPWLLMLFALLLALLVAACTPQEGSPGFTPVLPTIPQPTVAPTPTLGPGVTETPVTPAPASTTESAAVGATLTARDATVAARATTSPFSTAVAIDTSSSTRVAARRDGLSFELALPKDTYAAGEGGRAQVSLRNENTEVLFVQLNRGAVLVDEQGHEPRPYPWLELPIIGEFGRPLPHKLAPGAVLTDTLIFQVPALEQIGNHQLVLWAQVELARALPDWQDQPDNVWLRFEVGPVPLRIVAPDVSQQLKAQLQADHHGWRLKVTDARGQVPNRPLWGMWEAETENSASKWALPDNAKGEWVQANALEWMDAHAQIAVRAWVASPGFVTVAITQTVAGRGDAWGWFRRMQQSPSRRVFESLGAAQTASGLPLYRPTHLLSGAALQSVAVETFLFDESRSNVYEMYRLKDGAWLELVQKNSKDQSPSEGWGQARWDLERRVVAVGTNAGALIQQFGWWMLDWKVNDIGFELRAPVTAFSTQDLISIAGSVQP